MTGVIEVLRRAAIGQVIEDLVLAEECSVGEDWAGRVFYLPFR